MRDDYCDGIGNCLPVCPVGAISFSDVDIKNVKPHVKRTVFTCPSSVAKALNSEKAETENVAGNLGSVPSMLKQWPVQIKLTPINAGYFDGANLLIAADCSAFAYGNFHAEFMRNKVTLIGCPKLDAVDYTDKLTEIIASNNLKSVTVVRMEVPCCGGLQNAVVNALKASGKFIPWQIVTISIDGKVLDI